ncbi:MAG: sigma-70 family RNA polymerase sigma factor [Ignavibacteriae bacterium]|nr:sigma-70 family RNA polymerase sigma factor [Ignavibacteriota bacterium]MCB9216511.1 sigma-70 family RNA polymerase sigma factor [Ignavibacteria bacterium]
MRSLRLLFTEEGQYTHQLSERTNQEWVDALQGPEREQAIEELRLVLVRGLRFGLKGILGRKGAIEQIEDFVQDSLLRILDNLDSFRGESRFTTWAQKIAMRVAFSELRRKQWENVSLDQLVSSDPRDSSSPVTFPDPAPDPEHIASGRMAVELVSSIIDNELTELQQTALKAIIIHRVPMDEVARQLGTNRNALYKLLHDARKKVRTELEKRGLTPDDILAEFED